MICTLVVSTTIGPVSVANGFPNSGFENATTEGWSVGGRKDASATVISTRIVFDSLSKDRRFRNAGGWEHHLLADALDRQNNKHMLRISSNGYITATTESLVTIEPGKQYVISLIVRSGNGGPAIYYLDAYGIDNNGNRMPLGTSQNEIDEGGLAKQTVRFTAEAGQPHIGQRIGISARYRGTNFLDNARIDVQPIKRTAIESVVRNLPLLNTVDASGKPRFSIRAFDDFRYTRPAADDGTIENTGASFAALAQFVPKNNAEYTLYDLPGLTLNDGEAAAVTLTIVGARAHAGFAVDGNVFLLGRHGNRGTKRDDGTGMNPFRTPDYMMYIAKVSRTLGPETLLITRNGERIDWFTCGRTGSYTIKGLSESPRLSLFARGVSIISQLRKGKLPDGVATRLSSFTTAPRHPYGRPNTPGFPGIRTKDKKAFAAALSTDLTKPLADAEIQAMLRYAASYNAHGFGTRADPIFSLPDWYIPARIFLITRRKEALDHLIRIADSAIIIRNGFEVDGRKYGVRIGGEFDRYVNLHDFCSFPEGGFASEADEGGKYFNDKHEYIKEDISRTSDPANARMITPSMAAYCVSLHPEIWDVKVPDGDPCRLGTTYRQRAQRYLKELALNYTDYKNHKLYNFQTEYIWENYADFHRDRELYQAKLKAWEEMRDKLRSRSDQAAADFLRTQPKPMPRERRAGINRFVAATSCAGFAASAAETFGDRESAKAIDDCAEKILNSWFNTYQFYAPGHDGEHLDDPGKWYRAWGYQPNCVNPAARDYNTNTPRGQGTVRAEDRAHANFTLQGFSLLYASHRYEHIMTEKRMTDLARTFNEMVISKYNQWRPMPRASKHKNVDPINEIGGVRIAPLLMFTDFNAELKKKVIKALVEGTHERGIVFNRLLLAEMRARQHSQIPVKILVPR